MGIEEVECALVGEKRDGIAEEREGGQAKVMGLRGRGGEGCGETSGRMRRRRRRRRSTRLIDEFDGVSGRRRVREEDEIGLVVVATGGVDDDVFGVGFYSGDCFAKAQD